MENPATAYGSEMNMHTTDEPIQNSHPQQATVSSSWPSSPKSSSISTTTSPLQPSSQHQLHHQRRSPHLPRGIIQRPSPASKNWLSGIQLKINYEFRMPELLEEALESPGSGITCVGEGKRHRHFLDGNTGLAGVGRSVMKMVLRDECYLLQVPEGEAKKRIKNLISLRSMEKIGKGIKIETFVRPMMPLRKKNIWTLLKDDVQREDPSRTVARAMTAIIGAVYYDGGLEAVKKVMTDLGLENKAVIV